MKKGVIVSLAIIVLVLAGNFGIRAYQMHVVNKAVEDVTESLGTTAKRNSQRIEAQRLAKKAIEDEANTMCALNNDTNTCICRDMRTGRQIDLTFEECAKRTK